MALENESPYALTMCIRKIKQKTGLIHHRMPISIWIVGHFALRCGERSKATYFALIWVLLMVNAGRAPS